jgi:hypothetical protein
MAMIEQRPSPLRAAVSRALTGRKVAYAGGLVTLLLVLVFGTDSLLFWFTRNYGELLIPSSLGVPVLLPGLRFTRFAQESWTALGCEDFAALLLVGTVVRLLARHRRLYPSSGRLHRFLVGWGALMAGGVLSGLFRGLVVAREVAGGPLAYFGYPFLGAVVSLVWCVALGWIPGLAAVFAVVPAAAVVRAREWWAESGRLVLVYLVEPAKDLGTRAASTWRARGGPSLTSLQLPGERPPVPPRDAGAVPADTARRGAVKLPAGLKLPASLKLPTRLNLPGKVRLPAKVKLPSKLRLPAKVKLPSGVKLPVKFPRQRTGSGGDTTSHDENHKASSTPAP